MSLRCEFFSGSFSVLQALLLLKLCNRKSMTTRMEERLANLSLSADEEEELTLDTGDNRSTRQYCDLGLVGCFLTNRQINYTVIKHSLASLWSPGKGVSIKEAAG